MQCAENALVLRCRTQFAPSAPSHTGGQQRIAEPVSPLLNGLSFLAGGVLHKLDRTLSHSVPAQFCCCRGQGCRLQQGHVQVSRQHGGSGIAPQHAAQVVKYLASALCARQIGHGFGHVIPAGPAPDPFDLAVQGLSALHTVQYLFRISQRHRHACKLCRILNVLRGLFHQPHQFQRL